MLFFIGLMVSFGFFIWKYLPETKNKSFAEIAKLLGIIDMDENDNDETVPMVCEPCLSVFDTHCQNPLTGIVNSYRHQRNMASPITY